MVAIDTSDLAASRRSLTGDLNGAQPALVMLTFRTHSTVETAQLAELLASAFRAGDVLALQGDLGAGKTCFVQGLARALGCADDYLHSPTFTLVQEYAGRLPLYHIDAYRLASPQEFLQLGGEEYLAGDGLCCIEWPERLGRLIPPAAIWLTIRATAPASREFQWISPTAGMDRARWTELEAALRNSPFCVSPENT